LSLPHFHNASLAELTGLFDTAPDPPTYPSPASHGQAPARPTAHRAWTIPWTIPWTRLTPAVVVVAILTFAGCDQTPPIRQYTIDTQMPAALRSQDRMLGAIVPQDSAVWFFKLV